MHTLLCATSNESKFGVGKALFAKHGITLKQIVLDIDEIQGEDSEAIVRDKVAKAYALLHMPVVVSDDSWDIPGLNGFPGPYMKSMNHWLRPDDFIRLANGLEDRRIYLNQLIAYQDEREAVIFRTDIPGTLVTKPRGTYGSANMKVISLEGDDGRTISEIFDAGIEHEEKRLKRWSNAWQQLATWYSNKATP